MLTPRKIATFSDPKQEHLVPVSIGTRLASLAWEVSVTYFLSFLLAPEQDFLLNLGQHFVPILKDVSLLNFSLQTLIGLYLATQGFRFVCQLFFGHGFFDPLFALRGPSGFWGPRILGGGKIILDALLLPLLIFHIPLIKSDQGPVERWSSYQKQQDLSAGLVGHLGLFLTPFVVILSLYSPMIMGLTLFDGVQVQKDQLQPLAPPDPEKLDLYKLYSSKLFGLKTLSSLGHDRFMLIPQFDLSRSKGQLKLGPHILIYDQKEAVFMEFKLKARLRLSTLIQDSQMGVPLWSKNFSDLAQAFSLMTPGQKNGDQVYVFKRQACEEVQQLVRSSFALGLGSLIDHTFTYGPFIKGFVQLRRSLLSIVGPEIPPDVDLYKLGDTQFLRFRQLYDLPHRDSAIEQTLLPLCVTRAPVFVLKSDSDLPSAMARQSFMSEFFQQAEWVFEGKEGISNPIPSLKEEMNVFHLLDYAQWEKLEEKEVEKLEEGLSYFFFDLGHRTLQAYDPKGELKAELEHSMTRMIELLKLNRGQERTLVNQGLIIYLEQTLESLKNENKSYFGLTEGSDKKLWER